MAPMAGGAAPEHVITRGRRRPLVPGAPLSIAMVMGDFDLSGIGTVTARRGQPRLWIWPPHVRPGRCELPMMTGFIHTVYPRASVSMKMGSPLKVVGVLDTDVSTGVAGRIGPKPDMLPMTVRVEDRAVTPTRGTYHVQMVREPMLLPSLADVGSDQRHRHRGNLPEELTAQSEATFRLKGHEPIMLVDTFSGPRYTGPMGAMALFSPLASIANILVRNPMAPVRIEAIDCEVEIEPGPEGRHDRVGPSAFRHGRAGQDLKAFVTLKPFKGERETVESSLPMPADFPEGAYEAIFATRPGVIRRRFRNEPCRGRPARPRRLHEDDPAPDRAQADRRSTLHMSHARARAWPFRDRRSEPAG